MIQTNPYFQRPSKEKLILEKPKFLRDFKQRAELNKKAGVFKGAYFASFDPMTTGHYQMFEQLDNLYEKNLLPYQPIVLVCYNPKKKNPLFDINQRVKIIEEFGVPQSRIYTGNDIRGLELAFEHFPIFYRGYRNSKEWWENVLYFTAISYDLKKNMFPKLLQINRRAENKRSSSTVKKLGSKYFKEQPKFLRDLLEEKLSQRIIY